MSNERYADLKTAKIAEATMVVISKYGLQKTTMSDIAKEAGLSRQTLYNVFQTKDDVLRAAVSHYMARDLEEIQGLWQEQKDLDEKLDTFFEIGPLRWYDQIQKMPHATELLESSYNSLGPALNEAYVHWIAALEQLLCEHMGKEDAGNVADLVFVSAQNAKYRAKDRDQLLNRLALLRNMVVTTYTK